MDTRHKILPLAEARAAAATERAHGRRLKVVSGYFDVLQPAIVHALEAHAGPGVALVALVLDPPRPLTSTAARAELAAALRVIDYVLLSDGNPSAMVAELQPAEWVHEEAAHAEATERLIERVGKRHHGELAGRQAH